MDNNLKETKMIIRKSHFHGELSIGEIIRREYSFYVSQSSDMFGTVRFGKKIEFCGADIPNFSHAFINIEIPFIVSNDKLKIFNDFVDKIRKVNCKYDKTRHRIGGYSKYIQIEIDNETYVTDNYEELEVLKKVVDYDKISKLTEDFYNNLPIEIEKLQDPKWIDYLDNM